MTYGYKVFGDHSANPSKDRMCQIGNSFDTPEEAFSYARGVGYSYVEVTDPNGNVIEPEVSVVNFLLFAGMNYYPCGGYFDLKAKAATEDELRDMIRTNEDKARHGEGRFQWWQIVNANTHVIVDEGNC